MRKIFIIAIIVIVGLACKKDAKTVIKAYEHITFDDIKNQDSKMAGDIINNSNAPEGQILKPATVLVFKTNKGDYGKMRIISIGPSPQFLLTIELVVYDSDGTVLYNNFNATTQSTWTFDLDTGVQTADDTLADYRWGWNGYAFLLPQNSAKFFVYSE